MRRLPPLKAIQAFEAAARLGAFTAAAAELHITPSAISHQIRELESRLGIALFHRLHRSIILTDAGRRYAQAVSQGFGAIEAGTRTIERTGKSDILTIHSVPSFASQWLMPRISRFCALHPDIDVRLNASTSAVDLPAGEADIDIRYGPVVAESGVVVHPFPAETIVVLCAPGRTRGRQAIRKPADLQRRPLIHSEVNLYGWRDWLREHPDVALDLERGPRFDRSFMAISAAVDGLGVALESALLVERELDAGRLVLPFGREGPRLVCHSAVALKSSARLPKMQAFNSWLFEELGRSLAGETQPA